MAAAILAAIFVPFQKIDAFTADLTLPDEDPSDGENSYLNYYQSGSWQHSPDRDMYMILKQTSG